MSWISRVAADDYFVALEPVARWRYGGRSDAAPRVDRPLRRSAPVGVDDQLLGVHMPPAGERAGIDLKRRDLTGEGWRTRLG